MLPSPDDLAYFLEVAHTRNVTRAAERLGITQPSLSVALKRLEEAVGADLLIRRKSGVELTRSGLYLARQSQSLLHDWGALRSGALREAEGVAGRFTLGCHASVAGYAVPAFLPGLLKRFPRIELHLAHDLSRKIAEKVVSFQLDFGIVVNPVSHSDLVIRELCKDVVGLWSRDGKVGKTLLYDPELQQAQIILAKLKRQGIAFERSITSSSLETLARLAMEGAGTAILRERVAQSGSSRIKACGSDYPSYQDQVCLIYRFDLQKSAAAQAIIATIRKSVS